MRLCNILLLLLAWPMATAYSSGKGKATDPKGSDPTQQPLSPTTTGSLGVAGDPGTPATWLKKLGQDCAKPHRLYCISMKKRRS